jgi:hypothetical protein
MQLSVLQCYSLTYQMIRGCGRMGNVWVGIQMTSAHYKVLIIDHVPLLVGYHCVMMLITFGCTRGSCLCLYST